MQRVIPFERSVAARPAGTTTAVAYLPIKLHIIRRNDGTGGVDEMEVYHGLAATNAQFRAAGMQFYLCGPIDYLNDSNFYDFSSNDETALCTGRDQANAFNIYFMNSATLRGGIVGGYCSSRVFIINSHGNIHRTFTHEVGHFFGLLHTFENGNSANVADRELVLRSNCLTTGDLVCDTPADPSERPGASAPECAYAGGLTDAQGNAYTPPVRNAMSYYFCGNQLTPGQLSRMDAFRLTTRTNLTATAPPVAAPAALTATVNSAGTGQFQQVQLQWQTGAGAALGYFVERAVGPAGDFAAIAAVPATATGYVDAGAPAFQSVVYRVKPINDAAGFSNTVTVGSGLSYATPLYAYGNCGAGSADYLDVVRVSRGSTLILNSTAIPCGTYQAFTSQQVPLVSGVTYSGELRSKIAIDPLTGGGYYGQQYMAVWLDYNHNGRFGDAGELVFATTSGGANPLPVIQPFSFTVPGTALAGLTRMRVRTQVRVDGPVWDPEARETVGVVEDYSVNMAGVTAVRQGNAGQAMTLFPNPASGGRFRVVLSGGTGGSTPADGWLRVLDAQGRQVRKFPVPLAARETMVEAGGLATGIYLVRWGAATARLLIE